MTQHGNPLVATLHGVPADAPVATLQLQVCVNYGEETTYDDAVARAHPHAESPPFNVYDIGGEVNPPPYLVSLQSFSYGISFIPEPSSATLAGLGALMVFFARRRNSE